MKIFSENYGENLAYVKEKLRVGESYDVIFKKIKVADRQGAVFCINGFVKDEMLEKIFEYLSKLTPEELSETKDTDQFVNSYVTYIEAKSEDETEQFILAVLRGGVGMLVEGFEKAIIIDSRTYPARDVQEPESDKVLRGSHEGFVETVVFNTALIRKKIRNTNLTMKSFKIGSESKTDVVLCFLEDKVDRKQLDTLTNKLENIDVDELVMSHESLLECLVPYQKWNPFPRVRFTERPDAASACIFDGNVIVLTDGSPTAMIFPTGIFDFVQDLNDFYFPPVIGTFLRFIRTSVFTLSLFFIPLWYLIISYNVNLPDVLSFLLIEEDYTVPLIVQLLVVEFVIDTLRLASLNTPSALSSSFSVVGALVLGEFAVKSGWFVSDVVLFMAFVAISNFTQSSFALGYAIKIARTFLLIFSGIFKIWGFIAGLIIIFLVVAFTKTLTGYTYLYPLYPFDKKALKNLIFRQQKSFRYKVGK